MGTQTFSPSNHHPLQGLDERKVFEAEYGVVSWGTKRFLAEGPNGEGPLNSSLILAAKRTHRRDPLNGFKKYSGGWNIREPHYWAVSPSTLE
ncbi:hypothetical protein CsSME_00043912 [Camellia sinensis var. sinensis]